jgi:drug/metabolite transporter (DMT)-like permease
MKQLPFYTAKVLFSSCIFLISFIYILTQNLITYKKYGIFHQNEFYTNYDTLKILHLFFCLLGGLILFIGSFSLFYTYELTSQTKINCSLNTSFLTLLSFFILTCQYIFFGKKIRLLQLLGSVLAIMGVVVVYMAVS